MRAVLQTPVAGLIDVAEARHAARVLCDEAGFAEVDAGRVAIVAAELATNLAKHATGGLLLAELVDSGWGPVVELVSLDRGPGIRRETAFRDGFSTAGTPGTGLGAVARISDECDLYSTAAWGTVLVARLHARTPGAPAARARATVGGLRLPAPGEAVCGDAWAAEEGPGRVSVMVSDGLGHGEAAAEAGEAATAVFRANPGLDPEPLLEAVHAALRHTRGAAVAVAVGDRRARTVTYAGIGNIAAAVVSASGTHRLVSRNGIAGHRAVQIRALSYPWEPGALLVLHSDGITAHWDLDAYPGLTARHPSVVAGWLAWQLRRGTDDACAVVVRDPEEEGGRGR